MHASFEKPVPTNESVYTSEPAPTNKPGRKYVCIVLRTRAVKRKCVYLEARADKQTREKCVCLVLKACADEQTGEVCITRP